MFKRVNFILDGESLLPLLIDSEHASKNFARSTMVRSTLFKEIA